MNALKVRERYTCFVVCVFPLWLCMNSQMCWWWTHIQRERERDRYRDTPTTVTFEKRASDKSRFGQGKKTSSSLYIRIRYRKRFATQRAHGLPDQYLSAVFRCITWDNSAAVVVWFDSYVLSHYPLLFWKLFAVRLSYGSIHMLLLSYGSIHMLLLDRYHLLLLFMIACWRCVATRIQASARQAVVHQYLRRIPDGSVAYT